MEKLVMIGNDYRRTENVDIVTQHFGPSDNIKTFYHYTTMKALVEGIIVEDPIPNKEICMWATHCAYMNDSMEVQIGIDAIVDFFYNQQKKIYQGLLKDIYRKSFEKGISNQWRYRFIISFSKETDSLPMWKMYSDSGRGIAIEFFRDGFPLTDKDKLLQCYYAKTNLLRMLDSTGIDKNVAYAYIPSVMKNKAYKYEKEIRLIGIFENEEELYRVKNGITIPYKKVYFPKTQIKSITIGPSIDKKIAETSLKRLLCKRGFDHVIIKHSKIPYRNL